MKMALMLIQWQWKWFHLSALPLLQNLFCLPSLLNNLQKIMMIMILMIMMICLPLFSALPAKVLKPSTLERILPSRTFPQWISTSFQDVAQTRKPRITDMICQRYPTTTMTIRIMIITVIKTHQLHSSLLFG